MKKQKFLLLRGLPASGKSTYAKQLVEQNRFIRVNRDTIRQLLHFGKWSPRNEEEVVDAEKALVAVFLRLGKNVVVDDTNLGQSHYDMWKAFVEKCVKELAVDVHFEVKNFDTDIVECYRRDCEREKKVGREVILKMAMQYERMPENVQYVLCDLDGTLADNKWRTKFLYDNPNGKKDWGRFHAGIPEDPIRKDVIDQVEEACRPDNVALILVSARSEYCREMTEKWLKDHGVDYTLLLMRGDKDHRDDTLVKREILYKYFPDKKKIIKVFDDRPSVIEMWRQEGLDVVDVGDGIPF